MLAAPHPIRLSGTGPSRRGRRRGCQLRRLLQRLGARRRRVWGDGRQPAAHGRVCRRLSSRANLLCRQRYYGACGAHVRAHYRSGWLDPRVGSGNPAALPDRGRHTVCEHYQRRHEGYRPSLVARRAGLASPRQPFGQAGFLCLHLEPAERRGIPQAAHTRRPSSGQRLRHRELWACAGARWPRGQCRLAADSAGRPLRHVRAPDRRQRSRAGTVGPACLAGQRFPERSRGTGPAVARLFRRGSGDERLAADAAHHQRASRQLHGRNRPSASRSRQPRRGNRGGAARSECPQASWLEVGSIRHSPRPNRNCHTRSIPSSTMSRDILEEPTRRS